MFDEYAPKTIKDFLAAGKKVDPLKMPDNMDCENDPMNDPVIMATKSLVERDAIGELVGMSRDYLLDNEGRENKKAANAARRHGYEVSINEASDDPYVTVVEVTTPSGNLIRTTAART